MLINLCTLIRGLLDSQASSGQYMFQYFLKVVSTHFELLDGQKVCLRIFSVTVSLKFTCYRCERTNIARPTSSAT